MNKRSQQKKKTKFQKKGLGQKNAQLSSTPLPTLNGKSGDKQVTKSANADEIFTVYVQCLTGATLKLQISKADSNIEIKQLLAESIETCYITSYELKVNGKTLEDFADVADYPEIKADAVITMAPAPYDDKGARMHVYRLRELLDSRIDDMYLSTGSIHSAPEKTSHSYPSFSSAVSGESYSDLANALNCDMEFIHSNAKGESKRKKKTQKKQQNATTTPAEQNKAEETKTTEAPKPTEQKPELKEATPIPESLDSKFLFSPEKFSLKALEKLMLNASVTLPKCLKSITFSGWNPPPGNRKLCGDLFYLQIETLEKNIYHVTATPQGFYVNGTTEDRFDPNPSSKPYHSATLLGLLWKLSPRFKDEFPRLIACRTRKHPFEVTPIPFPVPQWIAPVKEHTYDTNRAEESLFTILGNDPRIQQREWNEEYQSCRELPSGTMEERIIRDRTLFKIHCDFVDAATKGAKAVVDKCLLPINPVDPEPAQVYIQNNIFFSYAVDSKNLDEKLWNNKTAYVNANNDLKGVIAFNEADIRGVHTLATCIVDYRGYRVIAQSIIPGILQGEQGSKHVYGSIDEGKTFAWNEKYHGLMKEAAKKLHIKEHTVVDKDGNKFTLCCPVECKGIVGSDGRFYVLDLIRTTPRDANFLDNPSAILRHELVKSFVRYKEQKERDSKEEKKEEKKETKKDEKKDDKSKQETEKAAEKKEAPVVEFNLDVFSTHQLGDKPEEQKKDEAAVKEISSYLVDVVIPQLVKEVKNLECCPLDGIALTDTLHEKGINMRYLGKIAKLTSDVFHFKLLCEQEMVVRAAKHEFTALLRETSDEKLSKVIEKFLNALFGTPGGATNDHKKDKRKKNKLVKMPTFTRDGIREAIIASVESKFGYKLPKNFFDTQMVKLATLRNFCMKVGVKLAAKDYKFETQYPFSSNDILGLEPVIKHSTPKSSTAYVLLEGGKRQLSMGQFESAFEFLSQAIVMFQQVKGPMNREVSTCFSYLATILFNASDLPQAILHQHKALIITRRVMGIDSSITCHLHQLLGLLCHNLGQTEFALKHFLRARYICELVYGYDHPDMAITLTNIAMMYQDLGDAQRSLKYIKKALEINEKILGNQHLQTAATHHALAITFSLVRNFKEALEHERKTYQILVKALGEKDPRVKESSQWLEHFTKRAVQAQREINTKEDELVKSLMKQTHSMMAPLETMRKGPIVELVENIEGPLLKEKQQKQKEETNKQESKKEEKKKEEKKEEKKKDEKKGKSNIETKKKD